MPSPRGKQIAGSEQSIFCHYRSAGWGYDPNGNVTLDPVRGFEFSYNLLNLPSEVRLVSGAQEGDEDDVVSTAVFWADGTREGVKDAGGDWISRYAGSLIYEGPSGGETPSGVVFDDGFIDCSGGVSAARARYFLRDHIGSVRVVAEDSNTVVARADYLPFGVRMTGTGLPECGGRASWMGFCGKENEMYSAADAAVAHWSRGERYQHFVARTYDPYTCTFLQVDPLAEKYCWTTPYSYCAGNPVSLVDPDGMDLILVGSSKSSVTFRTDLVNMSVNVGTLGVNWGGRYSLDGDELLGAALDLAGIVDPSGIADLVNAKLQYGKGDMLGAAVSVLGVVPYAGDVAKAFRVEKDVKAIGNAVHLVSFTPGNFRKNLTRLTGINPEGMQAHHILPKKFRPQFYNAGIDINDPIYGYWLEFTKHNKGAYLYNKKWEEFFKRHQNPSREQIMNEANKLMKDIYGEQIL